MCQTHNNSTRHIIEPSLNNVNVWASRLKNPFILTSIPHMLWGIYRHKMVKNRGQNLVKDRFRSIFYFLWITSLLHFRSLLRHLGTFYYLGEPDFDNFLHFFFDILSLCSHHLHFSFSFLSPPFTFKNAWRKRFFIAQNKYLKPLTLNNMVNMILKAIKLRQTCYFKRKIDKYKNVITMIKNS